MAGEVTPDASAHQLKGFRRQLDLIDAGNQHTRVGHALRRKLAREFEILLASRHVFRQRRSLTSRHKPETPRVFVLVIRTIGIVRNGSGRPDQMLKFGTLHRSAGVRWG
jgi:hypothetical protein